VSSLHWFLCSSAHTTSRLHQDHAATFWEHIPPCVLSHRDWTRLTEDSSYVAWDQTTKKTPSPIALLLHDVITGTHPKENTGRFHCCVVVRCLATVLNKHFRCWLCWPTACTSQYYQYSQDRYDKLKPNKVRSFVAYYITHGHGAC
jgi:hypothetical protein